MGTAWSENSVAEYSVSTVTYFVGSSFHTRHAECNYTYIYGYRGILDRLGDIILFHAPVASPFIGFPTEFPREPDSGCPTLITRHALQHTPDTLTPRRISLRLFHQGYFPFSDFQYPKNPSENADRSRIQSRSLRTVGRSPSETYSTYVHEFWHAGTNRPTRGVRVQEDPGEDV